MSVIQRIHDWAQAIRRDVVAIWLAARDHRVTWYAKLIAGLVAAYALSPIDLIPDFIPILGYLDDVVIVPLGIVLIIKLIPHDLMEEFRAEAARLIEHRTSRTGAVLIMIIWLVTAGLLLVAFWPGQAE